MSKPYISHNVSLAGIVWTECANSQEMLAKMVAQKDEMENWYKR